MKKYMPAETIVFRIFGRFLWFVSALLLMVNSAAAEDSLEQYLEMCSSRIDTLHAAIDTQVNTSQNLSDLFLNLDVLRDQTSRNTGSYPLPYVQGLAAGTLDTGWIAWSGTFNPPPVEWVQDAAASEDNATRTYLIDSSTRTSLVSLKSGATSVTAVFLDIVVHSHRIDTIGSTLLDDAARHTGKTLIYETPFQSLPAAEYLEASLTDPDFIETLTLQDESPDTPTQSRTSHRFLDNFRVLRDPQFFAGKSRLIPDAATFFLLALMVWILSGFLPALRVKRPFQWVCRLVAGALAWPAGYIIYRAAHAAIHNTNSAWWPDFKGEFGWISLILPLSCLLFAGGIIRSLFWLASAGIRLHRPSKLPGKRNPVPAALCQSAALLFLSIVFIQHAGIVSRRNLSDRLDSWLIERENLYDLAMETNLGRLLSLDSVKDALASSENIQGYPAYDAWNACDLEILNLKYGIEIRSADGQVLDRFSPDFRMVPVTPGHLERSADKNQGVLRVTDQPQPDGKPVLKIGIAAIRSDDTLLGFLIIQAPMGPYAMQPAPGQWGANALLFTTHKDVSPFWPDTSPIPLDPQWFEDVPPQTWIHDAHRQYHILVRSPRQTDVRSSERIFAILQDTPVTGHLAGSARMIILVFFILLPGIVIKQIRRFKSRQTGDTPGSFTQQLLGAFVLPVILLPLVFAITLHQVIDDTLTRQQQKRMNHTLERLETSLREQILAEAMRYEATVKQQLLQHDAVVDSPDVAWVVLNAQGRAVISSPDPLNYPLPFSTIARVFHQRRIQRRHLGQLSYQAIDPGLLTAQAILPYPLSEPTDTPETSTGTFVCEIPVTGELIQHISSPDTEILDMYSLGTICASNQPELYNTGISFRQMPGNVYRALFLELVKSVTQFDPSAQRWHVTGAIENESGDVIAALEVITHSETFDRPAFQPQDILLISTVLLLLIGTWTSIIFGRRLARPIQALTAGARQIADGKLDIEIPETGIGETRMLTRTFNRMARDLHQQRRALEERHEFISTLLARMSSAIIAVDDSGNVLTINRAFETLFDHPLNNVLHTRVSDLFQQTGLLELDQAFQSFTAGSGTDRLLSRFLRGGRTVHIAVVFAELSASDNRHGTLIVIEDITSTIQSSKLQAYADLARRIAHEVKNPLTPIQLSIEHLRQAWDDGADTFREIFTQCLTMIQDEVRSLEKIASEFSRFARFPKPVFQTEDIRTLLNEVKDLYQALPDQIKMIVDAGTVPLVCRYDHDQMKRVFVNLCQNGIQAMPDGGTLKISGRTADASVLICIEDTGSGMDEETLLHLFEPYFSTRREGTGLGLVITKAVIDAHDGDIQVESSVGDGTRFTIRLPRITKQDDAS